jgi:hypothetical protein
MNQDADDPGEDLLARPFLAASGGRPVPGLPDGGAWLAEGEDVRPYLMTGGRTGAGQMAVAMETVVIVSDLVRRGRPPGQAFERARILQDCWEPRSVAEVAARLGLPLGVAIVLVADLIENGLLDAAGAQPQQAHDVQFLERLIAGVSVL